MWHKVHYECPSCDRHFETAVFSYKSMEVESWVKDKSCFSCSLKKHKQKFG